MTKVTGEMVERVAGALDQFDTVGGNIGAIIYAEFPDDLRALVGLARRVIDPTEENIERCARAWDAEEASHCGEPSPWDVPGFDEEWRQERMACARAILAVIAEL